MIASAVLLVLSLLLLSCPSLSYEQKRIVQPNPPPPFPITASSYDSEVSLFFPLSSFSLSFRERYSHALGRLRRDHHFASAATSELIDYHKAAVTVSNDTAASCATLSPQQSSHLYFLPSWSILQLVSFLPFSEWSYVERSEAVRGVVTDCWHIGNLSVVSSAPSTLCHNGDDQSYYCNAAPSDGDGTYAQLVDQTNGLSSRALYLYNFSIDYFVQTDAIDGLDGSVPIRILIAGTRSDILSYGEQSAALPFQHFFDWLQFQPLDAADLAPTMCDGPEGALPPYNPPVPASIPESAVLDAPPVLLPSLPGAFSMLAEELTAIAPATPFLSTRSSPTVLWRRLDDTRESVELLRPHNHSASAHTLYYNYTYELGEGGLVWDVSRKGCSLSRLCMDKVNPLYAPRFFSFMDVFKSSHAADRGRYRWAGVEVVHGVRCWRFDAQYDDVLAPHHMYTYRSSFYFAPPQWQYEPPQPEPYLLPVLFRNDGVDLYYQQLYPRNGTTNDNSTNGKSMSQGTEPPASLFGGSEHDGKGDELPYRFNFTDSWSVFGFSAAAPAAFNLVEFGCPTVVPPRIPLRPDAYASTVVVSSSLTTQTYGYTEYFDRQSELYRVDGRYHGVDDIEVINLKTGLSVLYPSAVHDEAALGFASRVDSLFHAAVAAFHPWEHTATACTVTYINSSMLSSQFVKPSYLYYIDLYPFPLWQHADSDEINGYPVDSWQVLNQTNMPDGNILVDTATFYFSMPQSLSDLQVPIRFQFTRSMIFVVEDAREEQLEATNVDFVQWTAIDVGWLRMYQHVFNAPHTSTCEVEPFETRYGAVLEALASPADSQQYTTLPAIPSSFSALILTPLVPSSDELYALRWYVDAVSQRQRLDYAPLATRSLSNWWTRRSAIYQYLDDYGTYELHVMGCTLANATAHHAVNPLLTHHTGSLPDLFNGGFLGASVYELDTVDGVDVVCFQRDYTNQHNKLVNASFTFSRQACFAQDKWEQVPLSDGRQLASVQDFGTKTQWDPSTGATTTSKFSIRYDVLLIDGSRPSESLFNLTAQGCQPSGVTYTPPSSDDSGPSVEAPWWQQYGVGVSAAVLGLVLLSVALRMYRARLQHHQQCDVNELTQPLSSASTVYAFSTDWTQLEHDKDDCKGRDDGKRAAKAERGKQRAERAAH